MGRWRLFNGPVTSRHSALHHPERFPSPPLQREAHFLKDTNPEKQTTTVAATAAVVLLYWQRLQWPAGGPEMTQTKGDGGCDFPQGIMGLIVTLEKHQWQRRADLLAFSTS